MTILLPDIQTAFNQSLENLSWAINVYTIIFATLIIPFGRLAEKIGQNKFVFIGLIIFGIGSLLSGISANLPFMLFARFIQSTGAAAIIPTSMVIGISNFNVKNRNKVVAALTGSQGLAVAIGPTFGGIVSQYLSWRWAFYINVPLVIITLIIFSLILPMRKENTKKIKIDYIGSVLSMAALFSLSLGLVEGNSWGWKSSPIISLFIGAALSFIIFIFTENKSSHPMIDMKLFKSRNFNGSSLSLILSNFLLGGFAALIPTFLTRIHGETELGAALIITPYSISVMLSTIISSLLIKKINKKIFISAGFIIIAVGYYYFSIMNVSKNYNQLLIGAIVLGFGYGMVAATANILAVSDFKGSLLTDSQSVANVLRQVGIVFAIAIFMTVLSGNVKTAKQNTLSYAKEKITKLDLPDNIHKELNKKINNKLSPSNNNVSNINHGMIFNGIKIDNKKRNQIILKQFKEELILISIHKNILQNKVPLKARQKLYLTVKNKVNKLLDKRIEKNNQKIKNLISKIRRHAKDQLNTSFINVYKTMLIIPIIALIIVPIFKFKNRKI